MTPCAQDPLTAEERVLAGLLQDEARTAQVHPSATLDDAILAAARADIATTSTLAGQPPPSAAPLGGSARHRQQRRRTRWSLGVGTAAAVLLAVTLTLQLRPQPETTTVREAFSPEAALPSMSFQDDKQPLTPPAGVTTPAITAEPMAKAASSKAAKPAPAPKPAASAVRSSAAKAVALPSMLSPPKPFPADAPPGLQAGHEAGTTRNSALLEDTQDAMALNRAALADAQHHGARTERDMRTDTLVPVADDSLLSRKDWIDRIRTRYGLGDVLSAKHSLLLFVQTHSRGEVPDDLQPLLSSCVPRTPACSQTATMP